MANPYYAPNRACREGIQGKKYPKGSKVTPPSLRMHVDPQPALPGKSGPDRALGFRKIQEHSQSKGL